jgi:MFS transporter, PPP family, 3-phenylpropionic acid transporter
MRGSRTRVPPASTKADRDIGGLFALIGAAGAIFIPFFAVLLRTRGLTPDRIGLVLAVASFAGVVAAPIWSHVADGRLGTIQTLRASFVATAILALALVPTGGSLVAIAVIAGLLGAAQAPIAPLANALALTHLGPERETEFGRIRLWTSIGWAVAVVAAGAWFQHAGLTTLLQIFAAAIAICAGLTARFPTERPSHRRQRASRLGSIGEAFHAPRFALFLMGVFLMSVASSAAWSFVPLRIAARGGGPFLIGLSAGLAAVIEIPFFRASAPLTARFGLRTLYAMGAAVYVATMVAWSLTADPTVVAAVKALGGVGFGLIYGTVVVITGRLVPENLRNTGQTLAQTISMGIAPIIGSGLGGLVWVHLGPTMLFASAAACATLGTAVVWVALSDGVAGRSPPVPPVTARELPGPSM